MPERRNGHNYKSYVTALGEIVLLTERDQVKRVAEAHDAADARRHMEDVGHAGGSMDNATRPVVAQQATGLNGHSRAG